MDQSVMFRKRVYIVSSKILWAHSIEELRYLEIFNRHSRPITRFW